MKTKSKSNHPIFYGLKPIQILWRDQHQIKVYKVETKTYTLRYCKAGEAI